MKMNVILKLIVSLLACQLAGIIGGLFTGASVDTWYAALKKPGFTPPNWLFGPVWISLYLLMGISLFLVWKANIPAREKSWALAVFFIQLVLNVVWSYLFFYQKSPALGFSEILVLWIMILVTLVKFFPINRLASLLLVPYLLWVSFAAVLNYAIWHLNRPG